MEPTLGFEPRHKLFTSLILSIKLSRQINTLVELFWGHTTRVDHRIVSYIAYIYIILYFCKSWGFF